MECENADNASPLDDTELSIKYENVNQLRDDDQDLKRRLRITIGSYTFVKIKFYRRLATGHVENAFKKAASMISQDFGGERIQVDDSSKFIIV